MGAHTNTGSMHRFDQSCVEIVRVATICIGINYTLSQVFNTKFMGSSKLAIAFIWILWC